MISPTGNRRLDVGLRFAVAILLAGAGQLARLALDSPTAIPFITYVPFILLSGALAGFWPGLLTTALCTLEVLYFAIEPRGTFTVGSSDQWYGLGALAITGVVSTILFDRLLRARSEAMAAVTTRAALAREVEARQAMLESMIQNSPAAKALLTGPDFTIQMINPAYQALAPGEAMTGKTIAGLWPEAAPKILPLLQQVRDTETAYHATYCPLWMHHGHGLAAEQRYFDLSFVPLKGLGEAGQVMVLAVAIEVTRHFVAEESLRTACSELTAIYDNAPVILLVVDDQLRVEKVNHLAARFARNDTTNILGLLPGDALGCAEVVANHVECGHGPTCFQCPVRQAVLETLRGESPRHHVEGWLTLNANNRPEQRCLRVSTARMEFAGATKILVCAQDITDLKLAQLALQRREEMLRQTICEAESNLAEKTVLLQEVHHRVKNNLAVISSLLGLKAEACSSPEAQEALEQSQQRVHSMALIHELLYGNERLDRVDFAEYARQLVQGLEPQLSAVRGLISIEMHLDPIELSIARAVPCALILNELLSNAFKYAFPGGRNGRVRIQFRECRPGILELTVEDDGVGLPAARFTDPNPKSLGLRIVRILTDQIDGRLQHQPCEGTRLVLLFPMEGGAALSPYSESPVPSWEADPQYSSRG